MHLTLLARKLAPRIVARIALVAAFAILVIAEDVSVPLLDLTKDVPREQQESALPGSSSRWVGGQPLPSGYLLPLKIQLVSISPQHLELGDKFTVEVRIRNVGSSACFLPASQDSVAVFEHEGKGRRSFLFKLIFEDPKSGRQVSSVEAVSAGSETVKKSMLQIDPGKEVRVLFEGDLGPIADWIKNGVDRIQVRAGASEDTFEDNRYFVRNSSQPIVSENAQDFNPKN